MHVFHRFTPWSTPYETMGSVFLVERSHNLAQERTCRGCGYYQQRYVGRAPIVMDQPKPNDVPVNMDKEQ